MSDSYLASSNKSDDILLLGLDNEKMAHISGANTLMLSGHDL